MRASSVSGLAAPAERDYQKNPRQGIWASSIGYALDGFDLRVLGFILSAVSAGLGLTSTEAGSLVTWTLVGAVIGGIGFGLLSDIYGRVRVLTWTILLFA